MSSNSAMLDKYREVAGPDVIQHLHQLAEPLKGMHVVHVNSTRIGGGVAEILNKMVPFMRELGIKTSWEVISGDPEFYLCTKSFHNAIQGESMEIPESFFRAYEEANRNTAEVLRPILQEADVVIIHDPQPAAMISHCPARRGKWVWRCHIDASRPFRPVWKYLRKYISLYDASIFSLSSFTRPLPHPVYLIAPSIDPLHDKNRELDQIEIEEVLNEFHIDLERPLLVQISRYDRFKDPVGVIHAYKLAKRFIPDLQLVLAGGGAADDPEGDIVLREVRSSAKDEDDIKVLLLPGDDNVRINALQRGARIVLQKSTREGFGLTVTEAMWKRRPVIGGDTGGIRIQVVNHHTGFLVNTPEGAALRIRYLLQYPKTLEEMGEKAHTFVRENFLITRNLREYLTLMHALLHQKQDRIVL